MSESPKANIEEIQELLQSGDSFAAVEHIQRQGTPDEIVARYQSLLSALYWKAHDLGAVVAIGRAGIIYCLSQSLGLDAASPEREKLRSVAKALAYDVGSFTWPGWEEPGINPTADELAAGRDFARLNLRLAIELKKLPQRISMAHWLIGAHALAAREFDLAEQEFQLAQEVLPAPDVAAAGLEPCSRGFHAVARLCKDPTDPVAAADFEAIVSRLRASEDDEAKSFLTQLLAARRLFVPSEGSLQ